ncbi:MAG TPA: hypothetical protein VIA18_00250 [Polyangia bacterium]|nr:hypothetical protein [Polyangia bacterium]
MTAASSTRARGFALAAARALGDSAATFCGERGKGAYVDAAALAQLAATLVTPEAQARLAVAFDRVEPAGLARVDRSWYVAPAKSTRPAAAMHASRAAYAHLVPMDDDAGVDGRPPAPSLSRHSAERLERALAALGRRRVALAFIGAPRAGLAQLCARLGEPAASALVAEVTALRAQKTAAQDEIKAAQRAVFFGGGGGGASDDGDLGGDLGRDRATALFFRVGAGWLAPALARDGDELRRVAQRLPRALGQALVDAAAAPSTDGERGAALTQLANVVDRDL